MKKIFYSGITCLILFSSCNTGSFKKFKDGTEYKVITDDKGRKIAVGNIIEVEVQKKYKDSVLYDSRDIMPQFGAYEPTQLPPLFTEIFKNARVGDSIVAKMLTDSLYKIGNMPPFEKKGEYEFTTFKIINVFTTKDQADVEFNKWLPIGKLRTSKKMMVQIRKQLEENKAQIQTDDSTLENYLAAHKLSATKAPLGTYVVITNPGSGEPLTDTSIVMVNYTGRSLDGKVFDSNTDPTFKHTQPITVDLGQLGSVIYGWTDGLKLMKKGSKGIFLIPSSLGYGKNGSDKIKPNENLIFDVEIVDVLNSVQFQQQQIELQKQQQQKQAEMQQEQMKKMQELQKKDSSKNK